jgi:hypothetical protein
MNKLFAAGLLFAGMSALAFGQMAQEAVKAPAQTKSLAPQAAFTDWPEGVKPAAGYYDKLGRTVPTENDVNAAVYNWFSAFDHQVSPDYFVNRLASDVPGFSMQYPGAAEIKDAAGFKKWYQRVIDNVDYNYHHLVKLETTARVLPEWNPKADVKETGAVTGGQLEWAARRSPVWTVELRVRWRAPGKTSADNADACIDQRWELLENTASDPAAPRFKLHTMYACVVPGVTGAACSWQAASCLPVPAPNAPKP